MSRNPQIAGSSPNGPSEGVGGELQLELWSLYVDKLAVSIIAEFESHGIGSILLKGPAIASWLYADGTHRPYGDADLLVSPENWERAEALLQHLGFEKELAPLDHPGNGVVRFRGVGARGRQRRSALHALGNGRRPRAGMASSFRHDRLDGSRRSGRARAHAGGQNAAARDACREARRRATAYRPRPCRRLAAAGALAAGRRACDRAGRRCGLRQPGCGSSREDARSFSRWVCATYRWRKRRCAPGGCRWHWASNSSRGRRGRDRSSGCSGVSCSRPRHSCGGGRRWPAAVQPVWRSPTYGGCSGWGVTPSLPCGPGGRPGAVVTGPPGRSVTGVVAPTSIPRDASGAPSAQT